MADLTMTSDDPLAEMASKEASMKSAANNLIADHAMERKQDDYRQRLQASPVPIPKEYDTQFSDTLKDVGHRIAQVPQGVYSGIVNGVGEMANAVATVGEAGTNLFANEAQRKSNDQWLDNVTGSVRAGADAITPKVDTISGELTQGVSQFLTAFAVVPELKVAGAAAKVGVNLLRAGTAQAAAFNPNNDRLSNLIQSVPALKNPITDFIATKPGDSEAEGRLKNFLEGVGLTGVFDVAVGAAGQAKSLSQSFIDTLKGYRAANDLANTAKAADAVKPTELEHPAPAPEVTPATADAKIAEAEGHIDVQEGELTDEQRAEFERHFAGLRADPEELHATGEGVPEQQGVRNDGGSGEADAGSVGRSGDTGPLRVFRGSNRDLTPVDFEDDSLGKSTGHPSSGLGVWFSADEGYASRHGSILTEHHLDIRNPKVYGAGEMPGFDTIQEARAFRAKLQSEGYDGIVEDSTSVGGRKNYVAFEHHQVIDPATLKAGVEEPKVAPYEPPGIKGADTAHPADAASPASTPAAPVFDPAAIARGAIRISTGEAANFAEALADGRWNELPAMLDDTHRTIPFDSLSDGANLEGLFNAFEGTFGKMTKSAAGVGPVPDAVIQQLAKDIGGDVSHVASLFNDTTADGGLAARIIAGYNIMTASGREVIERAQFARSLNLNDPTAEQKSALANAIISLQKQLEMHAAIVGKVRQSSAEIGRALAAHARLKASSEVVLSNIGELQGTVLGPKAISNFLDKLGASPDIADLNNMVDNIRQKGLMGVIKEVAQGGMLSGLTTQVANITGNVANAILKVGERYIAAGIGSIRGVMMPTTQHADLRAALAYSTGAISGLRDAFPMFVKAATGFDTGVFKQAREFQMSFKDSLSAAHAGEPDVSASGRPIAKAISMGTDGLSGAELKGAQLLNITGQVIRYPGRFMGAIDNLNMGIGYQAELQARSSIMAVNEADVKGLTGDERDAYLDSRIADLRANPTDNMKDLSKEAGLYQSFQEEARTRFGEPLTNMVNSQPLVKLIIAPFVHRPLNMLRQFTMDYTVAGLLSKSQRELLSAGNSDTDLALARMTIGTAAMTYAWHLASSGTITGARLGPHDTESLDGISPYSIKIGGQWHRYDRVDPIGGWLAIGSEFHEQVQRLYDKNQENPDLATLARIGVQVMGMSSMDKSFMASVDKLLQAVGEKNGDKATTLIQQFISSNVAKFVPFSGALRTAAQEQDPVMRATGGDGFMQIWDTVKAGLPGLSKDLPPRRDILGRPMTRPEDAWWNPFAGQTAASDTMDRELAKIAVAVKIPPRSIDGVTLDAHQYDDLMRRATQSPVMDDKTLEGYLKELTSSPDWHQYDNTDDQGQKYKTELVQKAIDAAYDYGKQDFMQAHQDFADKHMQKIQAEAKHFEPLT